MRAPGRAGGWVSWTPRSARPRSGPLLKSVQGIIAGGEGALLCAAERAEDRPEDGATELRRRRLSARDIVMGIAASGVTPFVLGALAYARRTGAVHRLFHLQPGSSRAGRRGHQDRAGRRPGSHHRFHAPEGRHRDQTRIEHDHDGGHDQTGQGVRQSDGGPDARMRKTQRPRPADPDGNDRASRDDCGRILAEAGDLKTAIVMSKRAVSKETARHLLLKNDGIVRLALEDRHLIAIARGLIFLRWCRRRL